MEQIQSTDTNVEACKKEIQASRGELVGWSSKIKKILKFIQKLKNTVTYQEKQMAEWEQKCKELSQTIERKDKQMEEMCRLGTDLESSIQVNPHVLALWLQKVLWR